ncbi:MAG: hypothetical protein WB239_09315 [Acidimicrobiia bacterium]
MTSSLDLRAILAMALVRPLPVVLGKSCEDVRYDTFLKLIFDWKHRHKRALEIGRTHRYLEIDGLIIGQLLTG